MDEVKGQAFSSFLAEPSVALFELHRTVGQRQDQSRQESFPHSPSPLSLAGQTGNLGCPIEAKQAVPKRSGMTESHVCSQSEFGFSKALRQDHKQSEPASTLFYPAEARAITPKACLPQQMRRTAAMLLRFYWMFQAGREPRSFAALHSKSGLPAICSSS